MAIILDDDEFPYNSDDPSLHPLEPTPLSQPESQRPDPNVEEVKTLLRLLIGTVFEANSELNQRAKVWQAEINTTELSNMVLSQEDETDSMRLRYAMLGLLLQTPDIIANGLSRLDKVSSRVYSKISGFFSPLTGSRLAKPFQERYDQYTSKGESIVDTWINRGRQEEQISRAIVRRQAFEGLVDDVIDYLAQKPEVRDLVQQQSLGMTDEIVGEIRERSADVDTLLEDRIRAIFTRGRNKPKS